LDREGELVGGPLGEALERDRRAGFEGVGHAGVAHAGAVGGLRARLMRLELADAGPDRNSRQEDRAAAYQARPGIGEERAGPAARALAVVRTGRARRAAADARVRTGP